MNEFINQWKKPEGIEMTNQTIDYTMTKCAFDIVLQNQGITRADLIGRLVEKAYKPSSSSSIVSQLISKGNLIYQKNKLYAAHPEYIPLPKVPPRKPWKNKTSSVAVQESVSSIEPAAPTLQTWDADSILNNLNIRQARVLYEELAKIFGDTSHSKLLAG